MDNSVDKDSGYVGVNLSLSLSLWFWLLPELIPLYCVQSMECPVEEGYC